MIIALSEKHVRSAVTWRTTPRNEQHIYICVLSLAAQCRNWCYRSCL